MSLAFEVLPDPASLAGRAAEVVEEARPRTVALSGGSSPRATYALLGRRGVLREAAVYFVDERCVPPDHEASNYRMVREALGDAGNLHRIRGEEPPERAAAAYEVELRAALGDEPALDLVVLGMGADGHIASLFPGAPEVEETGRLAVATGAAYGGYRRVTLTLPVLNRARAALFIVTGAEKAAALARVAAGEPLPATLVRGARWLLDSEAAAGIQTPHRS